MTRTIRQFAAVCLRGTTQAWATGKARETHLMTVWYGIAAIARLGPAQPWFIATKSLEAGGAIVPAT